MVPFSIIFVGEFCVTIYIISQNSSLKKGIFKDNGFKKLLSSLKSGLFKDDSFRIFQLSPKYEEGAREYKRKKP